MSQLNGQGHQISGFCGGIAEHHALVTGAVIKGIGLLHAHVDIRGLLMQIHGDPAGIGIKAMTGLDIADFPHRAAGNGFIVHHGLGGDLTENVDAVGDGGDLTGYMRTGILLQQGIQDGIGDLVADLIGMTFGNAFGSEESIHYFVSFFILQLHCQGCSLVVSSL